jgi:hypothetical protein
MEQSQQAHQVLSVLVIVADPTIEALAGELIGFAGYRPIFDARVGAAGESLRMWRPAAVMLDISLPKPIVYACIAAAVEVGALTVLVSSTDGSEDIAALAKATNSSHFELPGGPKALRRLLDGLLQAPPHPRVVIQIPERLQAERETRSVHPAICAALASVARAEATIARSMAAQIANRMLRDLRDDLVSETTSGRNALRAAVTDYARILKRANVTEVTALDRLRSTLIDCSTIVAARGVAEQLLDDSQDWARAVYRAA